MVAATPSADCLFLNVKPKAVDLGRGGYAGVADEVHVVPFDAVRCANERAVGNEDRCRDRPPGATVSARVWPIWSSKSQVGRDNYAFGLETRTWGFREPPIEDAPVAGDLVLFGQNFSGTNVRTSDELWVSESADLTLGQISTAMYTGQGCHWPDEIARGEVLYPHRFGWVSIGQLLEVTLGDDGPLPRELSTALRRFAISHRAGLVVTDVDQLAGAIGLPGVASSVAVNLSQTPGAMTSGDPDPRSSSSQGRSSNAELNRAVERRAVELAIAHMQELGWTDIEELGKPYDLVCRRDGIERHVEVKGTTGSGADVLMTPNEVAHFRSCPHGADLVVVRDISLAATMDGYEASGGELLLVESYPAAPRDLQATGWSARVTGWPGQ